MILIPDNCFAQACYDQNTISDLEIALAGEADEYDMRTWGLSAEEWRGKLNSPL
jgi:hypothetical protein